MLRKVLVANRGAVAARVIRTLKRMGIRSVAVYSEADRDLPYVSAADESYCLGDSPPRLSYLNQPGVMDVLARSNADAVHPGYGFLAESADFAHAVEAHGACFIGPSPHWIEAMGHKTRARDLLASHGMPMPQASRVWDVPWQSLCPEARRDITDVGFPLLVKPADGGGGIGMQIARSVEELPAAWDRSRSIAARSFATAQVFAERLVEQPRHIEFQVLADRYGQIRILHERDCSVQRRYQKVIEEAPAPNIDRGDLDRMAGRIAEILGGIGYDVIGTVEMLYDPVRRAFHFLELNTRLQVEHAVTEEITGVDIVAAQVQLAAGESIATVLPNELRRTGHAIEARIYAEDPKRFFPSSGDLTTYQLPAGDGIRVETGYRQGNTVSTYYDPMLAKVIAHGHDRQQAIGRLVAALCRTQIIGVKTNLPLLLEVLRAPAFIAGCASTQLVSQLRD